MVGQACCLFAFAFLFWFRMHKRTNHFDKTLDKNTNVQIGLFRPAHCLQPNDLLICRHKLCSLLFDRTYIGRNWPSEGI